MHVRCECVPVHVHECVRGACVHVCERCTCMCVRGAYVCERCRGVCV